MADTGNNRIQKFNSSGGFLAQWGSSGAGDGQFNQPGGWRVDGQGNFYVADTGNHRIQKFNASRQFLWANGEVVAAATGSSIIPTAWPWMARGISMWRIPIITASRSSTPNGNFLWASGAVTGPATGSSTIPTEWRWMARGTSMWRIPIITASRNSTPTAIFSGAMGQLRHRRWAVQLSQRRGGGQPGERLCGGYRNNRIQKFNSTGGCI